MLRHLVMKNYRNNDEQIHDINSTLHVHGDKRLDFFILIFLKTSVLFVGPLTPLFGTSGVLSPACNGLVRFIGDGHHSS